jgi:hypothetical protein
MQLMSPFGTARPWSAEDVAMLQNMVAEGVDRQQIATALGRSREAIQTKLWRLSEAPVKSAPNSKARKRRKGGASFFLS